MEKELTGKLQEIIHKCQAWVDAEKFIPKKFKTQSNGEKFAEKILIELEAEMIKQKFSLDYSKIYLPTKYTVIISEADNQEFTGKKREVLINELNSFIERYFKLLGADYQSSKFVELKPASEIQPNDIKILHCWEDCYSPNIVINQPSPVFSNSEIYNFGDDTIVTNSKTQLDLDLPEEFETVFRKSIPKFYTLDIWRDGIRQNSLPIFQPEIAIGRGSPLIFVDVPLKGDLQISRHHAVLTYKKNDTFSLLVKGQNPAFVNNKPIYSGHIANLYWDANFQIGGYSLSLQK